MNVKKMFKITILLIIMLKLLSVDFSYWQSFDDDLQSLEIELARERIKTQILNERYQQESLRMRSQSEINREMMNNNARNAQNNQIRYRNIMNNINAVHTTANTATNVIRQIQNLR